MATADTNRALTGNTESLLSRAFGQKGDAMSSSATSTDPISTLAEGVMRSVVDVWARSGKKAVDLDQAVSVMRSEVKSFLTGPAYADSRECLRLGTLSEQWILADLVTAILEKIPTKAR